MNVSGLERFSSLRVVVVDPLGNFAFTSLPEKTKQRTTLSSQNFAVMIQQFASTGSDFLMQFHPIMFPSKSPKWFCWGVLGDNALCYYSHFKSQHKQIKITLLLRLITKWAGWNALILMDVRSRGGLIIGADGLEDKMLQMPEWPTCAHITLMITG